MRKHPSLRRHSTGQATARIDGKDFYFGVWPKGQKKAPAKAQAAYDKAIAEWLANGRRSVYPDRRRATRLSVVELVALYWAWAQDRYAASKTELRDIRHVLVDFTQFDQLDAAEFGLVQLETFRQFLVTKPLRRLVVNHRIDKVRRVFKWAAQRSYVSASVYQSLLLLPSLREGEAGVLPSRQVQDVPTDIIDATLPFVTPQVASMIRLQQWTGMRPGEAVQMKGEMIANEPRHSPSCDLHRWTCPSFAAEQNKTEDHHASSFSPAIYRVFFKRRWRLIPLGPKAQFLLRHWMKPNPQDYLFSPREIHRKVHNAHDHYSVEAYATAIARACKKHGIPHWHPHQLRHAAATQIQTAVAEGLAAASASLGHADTSITQRYAHGNLAIATEFARRFG